MRNRFLAIALIVVIASCSRNQPPASPAKVIFTEKPLYARGFEIRHLDDSSRVIRIFDPDRKGELLQSITWKPREVKRVVCLSTTHLSYIDKLGMMDRVAGTGFPELVMNKNAMSAIQSGKIQNISRGYETNDEVVFSIMPELFFVYPFGGDDVNRFLEKGIGCVQIVEYAEPHPLGRAEWIKVFGVLMGNEKAANEIFSSLKNQYELLQRTVQSDTLSRPEVFIGSYDSGTWFAPSGESFAAHILEDAGARYVFHERKESGNVSVSMEEFIASMHEVPYWGKLVSTDDTIDTELFLQQDKRLKNFKAVADRHLFYCNTKTSDYHGDALLEPHVILADLIHIFQPELLPDHSPVYFRLIN